MQFMQYIIVILSRHLIFMSQFVLSLKIYIQLAEYILMKNKFCTKYYYIIYKNSVNFLILFFN